MKYIYALSVVLLSVFSACDSTERKQPTVTEEHPVHELDSAPADNTAVADSSNDDADVPMGGGN